MIKKVEWSTVALAAVLIAGVLGAAVIGKHYNLTTEAMGAWASFAILVASQAKKLLGAEETEKPSEE